MIKYQEAIKIINKVSLNLSDEKVSTLDSLNRVCAKNILSPSKNPLSNNTAFDGFALLAKETKGLWINPEGIPEKIKNALNI